MTALSNRRVSMSTCTWEVRLVHFGLEFKYNLHEMPGFYAFRLEGDAHRCCQRAHQARSWCSRYISSCLGVHVCSSRFPSACFLLCRSSCTSACRGYLSAAPVTCTAPACREVRFACATRRHFNGEGWRDRLVCLSACFHVFKFHAMEDALRGCLWYRGVALSALHSSRTVYTAPAPVVEYILQPQHFSQLLRPLQLQHSFPASAVHAVPAPVAVTSPKRLHAIKMCSNPAATCIQAHRAS